jgi:hypothetical protein
MERKFRSMENDIQIWLEDNRRSIDEIEAFLPEYLFKGSTIKIKPQRLQDTKKNHKDGYYVNDSYMVRLIFDTSNIKSSIFIHFNSIYASYIPDRPANRIRII